MYLKTTIEAPAAFISCNEYPEPLRKYITAEEENDILFFLEILSTIEPSGSIPCSGIPAGFFQIRVFPGQDLRLPPPVLRGQM
ncbi:MAG TPA: hypothetical protein PKG52_04760 [bacterium]|nr:hypothetical protein [bacterium]HPS29465.1 hypothetical protein [bacterium]